MLGVGMGTSITTIATWPVADASSGGRAVKEQDHATDRVQLHEIQAFGAHLLRTKGVRAARRKRTAAAGNIEPIVLRNLELTRKKSVGGLLQATIRAGDHESTWSRWRPSERRFDCHALVGTGKVTRA